MASIFGRLGDICDRWLGVDAKWKGKPPRYRHKENLQRLCRDGWNDLVGLDLMQCLYDQMLANWSTLPCRGKQNWCIRKQPQHEGSKAEVALERTIVSITDGNWGNQIPTAAGIDNTGRRHAIDLIHRSGSDFTFFELKVKDKNPLFAAFEVVEYGIVYVFSRTHAKELGYDISLSAMELLRANKVRLQVLAPAVYYLPATYDAPALIKWLKPLEKCLNAGLKEFAHNMLGIQMGFEFNAIPEPFVWKASDHESLDVRKNLLWALHNRQGLDLLLDNHSVR